jgi:hypothetical protein
VAIDDPWRPTMTPTPPLAARQKPGLSETLFDRGPRFCRGCGTVHTKANPLRRWLECDAWDQIPPPPGRFVVVLCSRCSDLLIDKHPRLYHELLPNEPFTGAMGICLDCPSREGTTCTHPMAQRNGGVGVVVAIAPPTRMHLCGGRNAGLHAIWHKPADDCSGRPFIHEAKDADQT